MQVAKGKENLYSDGNALSTSTTQEGDSDDDFAYEEVEIEEDDFDDDEADTEDLASTLHRLEAARAAARGRDVAQGQDATRASHAGLDADVARRPEVVDDFVRNFLSRMGLSRTLEAFEVEWYELQAKGQLSQANLGVVPDEYVRNQQLQGTLQSLSAELEHVRATLEKRQTVKENLKKERDFHRMHLKRVAQEKNKLLTDIKRLRAHYQQYEPTIKELKAKYELAMKEKMLMSLERDRLRAKLASSQHSIANADPPTLSGGLPLPAGTTLRAPASAKSMSTTATRREGVATGSSSKSDAVLPSGVRQNPFANMHVEAAHVKTWMLHRTLRGHSMAVSNVRMHPRKPVVATASDDATWKLWSLPAGDLVMSGDGHKDWVAGLDFHPSGAHLASSSGDCSVKVWSFEHTKCIHSFQDHTQAVWSVAYHDMGEILASCSLDHSARLWDLCSLRCRQTLRGHVDSVNEVMWQPYSNLLCTASSDKTVSLWDARTSLCAQTFYGHSNSCNGIAFTPRGDTLASTDADGIVKVWDVRMVTERMTINVGPHPANKCAFDRSGHVLAIASDDGRVKLFSEEEESVPLCEFKGHEDAVQAVVFDTQSKFLVSAGSDSTFRIWS